MKVDSEQWRKWKMARPRPIGGPACLRLRPCPLRRHSATLLLVFLLLPSPSLFYSPLSYPPLPPLLQFERYVPVIYILNPSGDLAFPAPFHHGESHLPTASQGHCVEPPLYRGLDCRWETCHYLRGPCPEGRRLSQVSPRWRETNQAHGRQRCHR